MRLDIGAGPFPRAGYTPVDPYHQAPRALTRFMWDLGVEDGSVEAIWSSHSLEHISKHQVAETLTEWFRVLTPGGILELEVPDLLWVCRNFIEHPTDDWHMDTIFGLQTHDGEYHKTGFTEPILRRRVEEAGFLIKDITTVWSHDQDTLRCEATK